MKKTLCFAFCFLFVSLTSAFEGHESSEEDTKNPTKENPAFVELQKTFLACEAPTKQELLKRVDQKLDRGEYGYIKIECRLADQDRKFKFSLVLKKGFYDRKTRKDDPSAVTVMVVGENSAVVDDNNKIMPIRLFDYSSKEAGFKQANKYWEANYTVKSSSVFGSLDEQPGQLKVAKDEKGKWFFYLKERGHEAYCKEVTTNAPTAEKIVEDGKKLERFSEVPHAAVAGDRLLSLTWSEDFIEKASKSLEKAKDERYTFTEKDLPYVKVAFTDGKGNKVNKIVKNVEVIGKPKDFKLTIGRLAINVKNGVPSSWMVYFED